MKAAQCRATPASSSQLITSQARLPLSLGFKYNPEGHHHNQLPASAVKKQGVSEHKQIPKTAINVAANSSVPKGGAPTGNMTGSMRPENFTIQHNSKPLTHTVEHICIFKSVFISL